MNLRDVARERTVSLRDTLGGLEKKRSDFDGRSQAEQERIKRIFTDLATCRREEERLGRQLSAADLEIADVRNQIDELEKKRTELIEKYTSLSDARTQVEGGTKDLRNRERKLNEDVRSAQDFLRSLERERGELDGQRSSLSTALQQTYADAFNEYSVHLRKSFEGLIGGQAEKAKRADMRRAFVVARGTNAEMGMLCDQRDELRSFLESSRVPGVREHLENRLREIETRLEQEFPGALLSEAADPAETLSAELFYLRDDDEFVLLFPFEERIWNEMESTGAGSQTCNMAATILYGAAKALGLKPSDGEFCLRAGRIAFAGRLDDTEIAVLASSPLPLPNLPDVYLSLSRMPSEIEEALKSDAVRY
ncbi:MAG TPA: hypothetical protein PLB02_06335 [Thermoanaerobaculia bacterium]|nr:hypothetical protein [Thermoanaerobaculia bacterium]HQR66995.1 hypothetical protein [Thermoanaerobaculia bacterium]